MMMVMMMIYMEDLGFGEDNNTNTKMPLTLKIILLIKYHNNNKACHSFQSIPSKYRKQAGKETKKKSVWEQHANNDNPMLLTPHGACLRVRQMSSKPKYGK